MHFFRCQVPGELDTCCPGMIICSNLHFPLLLAGTIVLDGNTHSQHRPLLALPQWEDLSFLLACPLLLLAIIHHLSQQSTLVGGKLGND